MKKHSPFLIAGKSIPPNTKTSILYPAPNINNQVNINIPVHVFHGKYPGPKLFIIGTIHGDELNSIEIIRRIHHHIHVSHLHGTILTLPVANIYGLMIQSRYLPDRRDLNRSFPGSKKGSMAARLAHGILEQVVSCCDFGIDLHTGALGRINMPQLRVNLKTPGVKALAMAFDAPIIMDVKLRDGSLREAASEMGIPLLVYEGGEALRYNELCIRAGVRGILGVLHHLKMIKNQPKSLRSAKPIISKTSRWIRASASGFVQPAANLLTKTVKKGQLLAHIHDPCLINKSIAVTAPFDGIVIGQMLKPLVSEGEAMFHIASFKKIKGVNEAIDEYHTAITNLEELL